MFYTEQPFLTEDEVRLIIQESSDDAGVIQLREELLDPVIQTLQDPKNVNRYIQYGSEFLEANAEMLAKQYPTKYVTYPRKYVDEVLGLFGFTVNELKSTTRKLLKTHVNNSDFLTVTSSPTNIIHALVLVYADMLTNDSVIKGDRNNLRDSARQQLGVTMYGLALRRYFPSSPPNPKTMEYTYMRLDRSWAIVRDEDIITWIGGMVNTSYAFWRSNMSLNLSPQILANFINRVHTTIFQSMRGLANQYHIDIEAGNEVGDDTSEDDEYVEKREFTKIRNTLVRRISGGDELYKRKGSLYKAISNLKNVKIDVLYDFAQKVEKKDIGNIIDVILYVFITKEGNRVEDINSSKYIQRITKFPTAIDRAIAGKPIILPMSEKYETDSNIVKAYICLIATYIMQRINDVMQS